MTTMARRLWARKLDLTAAVSPMPEAIAGARGARSDRGYRRDPEPDRQRHDLPQMSRHLDTQGRARS
jgi:hypothetical protein